MRTRGRARALSAVAATALLCLPALASGEGEGGHGKGPRGPEIQSTSFAATDHEATLAEAGVARARKVTLHVGEGRDADRFKMKRAERAGGVTFWGAEVPNREDKCAPVRFVARGKGGTDERDARICAFGPEDPEPPPITPDLP
jgi:hypothetical protein